MGIISRLFGHRAPEVVVETELTQFVRMKVVGESFYQPALLEICGAKAGERVSYECFAELVPEPDNPKDPNAVMVKVDGKQVGYLTREDASEWQPRLLASDQPAICRAFIGCLGRESGNPNLGVSLTLPDYD